jgi:Cdc6-like AAA superfamily ATPase
MSNDESPSESQTTVRLALVDLVFTPAKPVQTDALFAGRAAQVEKVYNTMVEPGRHAVLYGERGVGKTSLANIVRERLERQEAIVPKVSADSDDTYDSLWRKVFSEISITSSTPSAGFLPGRTGQVLRLSDQFDVEFSPHVVVDTLSKLPFTVVMIDEFDRIETSRVEKLIADTIKGLSDVGTGATILIVGVADDIFDLVGHHPSIERGIREIHLPRMAPFELEEILDTGFERLELSITHELRRRMVNLSHGFPHYTHVLGKYAAQYAIENQEDEITEAGFRTSVEKSVEDTYRTTQDYYLRVTSASNSAAHPYILLAAAVAPEDEYGAFYPADLIGPLRRLRRPCLEAMIEWCS